MLPGSWCLSNSVPLLLMFPISLTSIKTFNSRIWFEFKIPYSAKRRSSRIMQSTFDSIKVTRHCTIACRLIYKPRYLEFQTAGLLDPAADDWSRDWWRVHWAQSCCADHVKFHVESSRESSELETIATYIEFNLQPGSLAPSWEQLRLGWTSVLSSVVCRKPVYQSFMHAWKHESA